MHDPFLKTFQASPLPKSYITCCMYCSVYCTVKADEGSSLSRNFFLLAVHVFLRCALLHIHTGSCTEQPHYAAAWHQFRVKFSKDERERTTGPADVLNPHRKIYSVMLCLFTLTL